MQQHPIPQNVTQYQFRLVGDMTLKQFLELALGLLLAYLFFASNLIFIFKWPLIILSILLGIGLAFFPIEDRPLDQWIVNFIKAIYGPTRFIWKKSDKIPHMFTFTPHAIAPTTTITKTIKAPSAVTQHATSSDLSDQETAQITSLDSLFAALPPTPSSTINHEPLIITKPSITIRKLKPIEDVQTTPVATTRPMTTIPTSPKSTESSTRPGVGENVLFTSKPSVIGEKITQAPTTPLKTISLPAAPKVPGIVVGIVVDKEGKLLENSIVELIDAGGIPQRAMKTNALGQFYTATPLSTGSYTIQTEKDNYVFSPQQLSVTHTIIPPFELRATA